MKIFLAGGYSVMNIKGREQKLFKKINFQIWRRLISFFDFRYTNNHPERVLSLKTGENYEDKES